MRWIYKFPLRLRSLFRKTRVEQELSEELRFHLESLVQENIAKGMTPGEARSAARREFGGVEQLKEECRDTWGVRFVAELIQDLRYGLRQLRRNPGFTAVAVITLALGVGASTAIFSVVDAVLLSPLPYPNPQRIVRVWEQTASGHRIQLADPNFDDFRAQNHTLSALAEYASLPLAVAGGSEPVRVRVSIVSKDFFKALGGQPFLGRTFSPEELHLDGARAVIVSYGYWQQYLGASKDLSQLHLTMNGGSFPVVGVMPHGLDFPQGATMWIARERFPQATSRTAHSWNCIGRVRKSDTVVQARADLNLIARRIRVKFGKRVDLTTAAVVPLARALVGNVRTALLTLLGAVMLLFLVACANVTGLLLARTLARQKELAVRVALGSGRGRLVRQLLAESLVLAFAGGFLGVLIATWVTNLLPAILPANLPLQHSIAINATVLSFTLASTLMVAVGLGVFAAWRASQVNLTDALSASSRSFSGGGQRLRSLLIIGEIAATLVMLAGAALLGRSFLNLISVSPGFHGENVIVAKVSRPPSETSLNVTFAAQSRQQIERRAHFFNEAVTRLRAIPGVQSAAVTGGLPIADPDGFPEGTFLILDGRPTPENWHDWDRLALDAKQTGEADYCVASADFFRTLGVPLTRGRLFSTEDGPDTPNVAVISEALAHQQWPHENPIGQVIDFGNMDGNLKPLTIIGVVGDIRAEGLNEPPSPIIYVDYRQRGFSINTSPAIVLRSSLAPSEVVPTARHILHDLNPNVPVQFSTFEEALGGWMAERRFLLLLAGVFAGAALTLAAVGLYGLVAHSVARRTQEIGVRMALGAQKGDVLRMVIREGLKLAVIGVSIGISGALALTRFLSSLLYGVKPADPLTFVAVSLILIAVALLACYVPARRAAKVDPVVALRYE